MDISADKGFRILADLIRDHAEKVALELKEEAAYLERLNFPEPSTERFRVKAAFFREYMEGQAAVLKQAIEDSGVGV